MKRFFALIFMFSLFFLWGACAPKGTAPLEKPLLEQKIPIREVSPGEAEASWEQKWEKVLDEARKEGKVHIYTTWGPYVRLEVLKAFKDRYGITVEMMAFGRGDEVVAKVQTEQRAGLYLADVFGGGAGVIITLLKYRGLLGPIKPWLILPEVIEPQNWRVKGLPFMDDDDLGLAFLGGIRRGIVINTDLVKEGEIISVKDLLKPKYKGKININDPTVVGGGNIFLTFLAYTLWGEEKGIEFFTQLLKQQEAMVQRDTRLQVESLARGKHAIAFAPLMDLVLEFQKQGAPLKIAPVEEDTLIAAGSGGLGLPTKFAHPNAIMVFVNWFLSKEGQTVSSKAWGSPSNRIDVPTEGLDLLIVPKPGIKYFLENEESLRNRSKTVEWSRKLIEALR